jgi:hypothetical protein
MQRDATREARHERHPGPQPTYRERREPRIERSVPQQAVHVANGQQGQIVHAATPRAEPRAEAFEIPTAAMTRRDHLEPTANGRYPR